ncbi:unnamed protein product [Effrenium voratum]|nr:unnamed protein product [Effrenium voratum]
MFRMRLFAVSQRQPNGWFSAELQEWHRIFLLSGGSTSFVGRARVTLVSFCKNGSSKSPPKIHQGSQIRSPSGRGLSSQTSQGPTNIAQASGRLAARGAALSEALGEEVTGRVEELCPQGIANAARSFGTAQSASAKVYEALAGRLTEDPSAQNLANAARTRAAAKLCDRQVFAAIADHAIQKISEFQSQGPANLARWLARTALSSRPSLRAAARRAEQVMDTLDPQNSSNAARAPATLEAFDRPLMAAAAAEAIRQMGAFRPQHLANLGWRPGSLRESRWEPAARAMAERGAELCHEFDPQGTANQVWAFGRPG